MNIRSTVTAAAVDLNRLESFPAGGFRAVH
jgi:hypothetical protein